MNSSVLRIAVSLILAGIVLVQQSNTANSYQCNETWDFNEVSRLVVHETCPCIGHCISAPPGDYDHELYVKRATCLGLINCESPCYAQEFYDAIYYDCDDELCEFVPDCYVGNTENKVTCYFCP